MRVLNAGQMREADRRTIEEIGIPSIVLMENAGPAGRRGDGDGLRRALGGAAWRSSAAAATTAATGSSSRASLWQRGVDAQVYVLGAAATVRGDARTNLDILGRLGLPRRRGRWRPGLGTAQRRRAAQRHRRRRDVRHRADGAARAGCTRRVAQDLNAGRTCPSWPSTCRAGCRPTIRAAHRARHRRRADGDAGAPKLPLVLPPAETLAGSVVVADIGIPANRDRRAARPVASSCLTPRTSATWCRHARADAHKGTSAMC